MNLYLLLPLLLLAAALILQRFKPAPIWNWIMGAALTLAILVAMLQPRPGSIAKSFEVIFHGSGYGVARILIDSGQPPGPVLLLLPGEGKVDDWRRQGFEAGIAKSGFQIVDTVKLPMVQESGNFAEEAFSKALIDHPEVKFVAAFAGLPGAPAPTESRWFAVFHPTESDKNMAAWWKSKRLLGVIAPRLGEAPVATGKETLAGAADLHFRKRVAPASP